MNYVVADYYLSTVRIRSSLKNNGSRKKAPSSRSNDPPRTQIDRCQFVWKRKNERREVSCEFQGRKRWCITKATDIIRTRQPQKKNLLRTNSTGPNASIVSLAPPTIDNVPPTESNTVPETSNVISLVESFRVYVKEQCPPSFWTGQSGLGPCTDPVGTWPYQFVEWGGIPQVAVVWP
jgi:hypothetical protein